MARKGPTRPQNPAHEAFWAGHALLAEHPIFRPLNRARIVDNVQRVPEDGWVVVASIGVLYVRMSRRAAPEEWAHVLAHALLHLGMGHFRVMSDSIAWQVACDCCASRFLRDLKFGRMPADMFFDPDLPRAWFISSYPLLGSLAAAFELIEDPQVCLRMQIAVAAVDAEAREIYINPSAHLDEQGARFVIAHELLHVGLCHQGRRRGRDPYLWNVA